MSREAAAVVVEHAVPALGVSVRSELRIAARVVVEAINPALLVTHDQLGGVAHRQPSRVSQEPRPVGRNGPSRKRGRRSERKGSVALLATNGTLIRC